jgi:hypothetical protein
MKLAGDRKLALANRFPPREKIIKWADNVLLFTLFLALSTPLELGFGLTIFWIGEPIALLLVVWWFFARRASRQTAYSESRWIKYFFGFVLWAVILWGVSENWQNRTPILHALMIGAPLLVILRRYYVERNGDWKEVSALFVFSSLPNLIVGLFQHENGIGIGPKGIFGWGGVATSIPMSGFFGHPNDFAVYLYWPLIFAAGLISQYGRWGRWFFGGVTLLCISELIWSDSRSTIITLSICLVALVLMRSMAQRRWFVFGMGIIACLAFLVGLSLVYFLPPGYTISMAMSGRDIHWAQVIGFIFHSAACLPFGFLGTPFPLEFQPHNIYLMAWFYYGWPGLFVLLAAAWSVFQIWQRYYSSLRKQWLLASAWMGMAGFFFINGMGILYFHEPFFLIGFFCVVILWNRIMEMRLDRDGSPEGDAEFHEEKWKHNR